jgi:hypothetical protein
MASMSLKSASNLDQLDADALRALAQQLMGQLDATRQIVAKQAHDIQFKETHIRKLTHEIAVLRRYRFGKKSEQLGGEQGLLLEDAVDADIAAIEQELINLGGHPQHYRISKAQRNSIPQEPPYSYPNSRR